MIKKIREWLDKVHMGMRFARYPQCDHLNRAIGYLLEKPEENRLAIEEICYAILKADGYFFKHIVDKLEQNDFGDFVEAAKIDG